jgi:hypothetical protein
MRSKPSISCERTRALVSCGLDGRLHDLERRFLEDHLRRCPECKSFADETAWFTNLIRATPLEPTFPVAIPHRRRRIQLRSVASAAAAAVVLFVAGNVALSTPGPAESEGARLSAALSQGLLGGDSIRSLRRPDVVSGRLSFSSAGSDSSLGTVKPLLSAAG